MNTIATFYTIAKLLICNYLILLARYYILFFFYQKYKMMDVVLNNILSALNVIVCFLTFYQCCHVCNIKKNIL